MPDSGQFTWILNAPMDGRSARNWSSTSSCWYTVKTSWEYKSWINRVSTKWNNFKILAKVLSSKLLARRQQSEELIFLIFCFHSCQLLCCRHLPVNAWPAKSNMCLSDVHTGLPCSVMRRQIWIRWTHWWWGWRLQEPEWGVYMGKVLTLLLPINGERLLLRSIIKSPLVFGITCWLNLICVQVAWWGRHLSHRLKKILERHNYGRSEFNGW